MPSRAGNRKTPSGTACRLCKAGSYRKYRQECHSCFTFYSNDEFFCRRCPHGFKKSKKHGSENTCTCPEGKGVQNRKCSPCLSGTVSGEDETCIPLVLLRMELEIWRARNVLRIPSQINLSLAHVWFALLGSFLTGWGRQHCYNFYSKEFY